MNEGIVYLLTNPAMPGMVKIGKTGPGAEARMKDLYTTGVPLKLECAYSTRILERVFEPASHRLKRTGRNLAIGPDSYPLRMHNRCVGLEVTELLLLLGVQPPFTTSLFWRLVKAAFLARHIRIHSQTDDFPRFLC